MSTEQTYFRPYAPPANVQAILHRLRRMNMPLRVNRDFLQTTGISESIIPRVTSTLRFLSLTNEFDQPTDTLRNLAKSTDEEYVTLLKQAIQKAYADDFLTIDPGRDTQDKIINAFQRYVPRSQHGRQVTLFLGLCREAGIPTLDLPRRRSMQNNGIPATRYSSITPAQRGIRANRSAQANKEYYGLIGIKKNTDSDSSGQILGITLEDAAHLTKEEFREVWNAMGTLIIARAKRQKTNIDPSIDHDSSNYHSESQ